jgi:hypothetical protein
MNIKRNIAASSSNQCCSWNVTIPHVFIIVFLHAAVNNMQLMTMTCEWKNGLPVNSCRATKHLVMLSKNNVTEVLASKPRHLCAILTKSVVPQEIFIKIPSIKFLANTFSGSRDDTSVQTDRLMETTKAVSCIYDSVLKKGREKSLWRKGWP